MAKFGMWRNGFLEIAGVDMSDHCTEFSVQEKEVELPNDAHGDFVACVTPGMEEWTLQAKFLQDFASTSIHFTLRNAKQNRLPVSMRYRADKGITSALNPMYSGSAYVTAYTGFQGKHADNMLADATLRPAIGTPLVEYLT